MKKFARCYSTESLKITENLNSNIATFHICFIHSTWLAGENLRSDEVRGNHRKPFRMKFSLVYVKSFDRHFQDGISFLCYFF